jgi:spore coat protein CotH
MKIIINKRIKEKKGSIKKSRIVFYSLLVTIFFILGIWSERYDARLFFQKSFKEFIEFSSSKIFSNTNNIDKIVIDIKYKNYQKISNSREKAMDYGRLKDEFTKWVPAKIQLNGKKIDIKVKLKGTHDDHWAHPYKWSFKIKTKNNNENIYGLKSFAVQPPATTSYLYEWLFHIVLKEENLIAHNVKFINLVVNGNNLGVYTLIEQISKELIEKNKRREGPIISFDKELWIEEVNNINNLGINNINQFFWTAQIKPSRFKKNQKNTIQEIYLNKAISLLEAFRKRELKTSQVFDTEQFAKYMAVRAIFASVEFDWKDIKFYYNPITELLEPVAREVHSMHHDHAKLSLWAFNAEPLQAPWNKHFFDLL